MCIRDRSLTLARGSIKGPGLLNWKFSCNKIECNKHVYLSLLISDTRSTATVIVVRIGKGCFFSFEFVNVCLTSTNFLSNFGRRLNFPYGVRKYTLVHVIDINRKICSPIGVVRICERYPVLGLRK